MSNQYGPWATLINTGVNPQLSAFWRRRLTMLVPASRTSPVLSLRNLLFLAVAGILACILPTLFFTSVAAQEKKPTESKSAGDKAPIGENNLAPPAGFIDLPAYADIWQPRFLKQLSITSEQEKKLREISRVYVSERMKLSQEGEKLPADWKESQAQREELHKKWEQLKTKGRKQMEESLTTQQLDAYKKIVLPFMTVDLLQEPEVFKSVVITPEQKEKLWQLHMELEQRIEEDAKGRTGRILALLDQKQMEKLRSEFERRYRESLESGVLISAAYESSDSTLMAGNLTWTALSPNPLNVALWSTNDDLLGGNYFFVPVYYKLSESAVRKSIGLSANQEKQLKEIADNYDNFMQKSYQEIEKIPPEEQTKKQDELRQQSLRMRKQIRLQLEALLTPGQLAKLKEKMFNDWAGVRLVDDRVQEEIGLIAQQKTAFNRISLISQERQDSIGRINKEICEKELAVLTPQQQEKLREIMDRRGW